MEANFHTAGFFYYMANIKLNKQHGIKANVYDGNVVRQHAFTDVVVYAVFNFLCHVFRRFCIKADKKVSGILFIKAEAVVVYHVRKAV